MGYVVNWTNMYTDDSMYRGKMLCMCFIQKDRQRKRETETEESKIEVNSYTLQH